jgi:branched-chain amino acid transport system ATP-binding protein
MAIALQTLGLNKRFGGLLATNDVSFTLEEGARHALIGPNGAGKTTLVNLLTGVIAPTSGKVLLHGTDVTRLSPDQRVRRGLARTFQINQLFPTLTPLDTLGLAMAEQLGHGGDWFREAGSHPGIADAIAEVAERFRLTDVLTEKTSIAVAFASQPRVLLLDEPAAGVPESERHDILAAVAELPRSVSVLLIEHDMDLVFSFAERISVLVNGALFTEASAEEIANDPRVQAVYLGDATHA